MDTNGLQCCGQAWWNKKLIMIEFNMKKLLNSCFLLLCSCLGLSAQTRTVNLKIIQTSDVHGNYYPHDFITGDTCQGGLARVASYVKEKRRTFQDKLILLDNGDILQGQPTAYYYNYIDTESPHLCAEMMNFMKYDLGNMGNHDVETGVSVFNRWISDCQFPVLGANVINTSTGEPHLPPYQIIQREGVKIAVLGLITPAIPVWLPETLWQGLRFDDMEQTAAKWMKIIKEKEHPDLVVGLFHAGQNAVRLSDKFNENASLQVAKNVPGFDIVLMGHDHTRECKKVVNSLGDSVLVANPANDAFVVSDIDIHLTLEDGKVIQKKIDGELASLANYLPDDEFMTRFSAQYNDVRSFVGKKIGRFTESVSVRPAYFGPSAFIDFIHSLQLEITGADLSFTAPLSFDTSIEKGEVYVSDMFKLYKYENMLYVMSLSGREIKDYLEESYFHWTNRMRTPHDQLLWFKTPQVKDGVGQGKLQYFSFNFDSASGIRYTVDVTKPKGKKITILSLADGRPFEMERRYKVALSSYRGNGGGELLTKGAGLSSEELKTRILYSTDKDLRYYLMKFIEKKGVVTPRTMNQWQFIPQEWVKKAIERDYKTLFGEN